MALTFSTPLTPYKFLNLQIKHVRTGEDNTLQW